MLTNYINNRRIPRNIEEKKIYFYLDELNTRSDDIKKICHLNRFRKCFDFKRVIVGQRHIDFNSLRQAFDQHNSLVGELGSGLDSRKLGTT